MSTEDSQTPASLSAILPLLQDAGIDPAEVDGFAVSGLRDGQKLTIFVVRNGEATKLL